MAKVDITIPPRVKRGQVFLVAVRLDHPMRSGLGKDPVTGRRLPELYLKDLEVIYAGRKVSWMELSPALSERPVVKFYLRADQAGSLLVRARNNQGKVIEGKATVELG